MTVEILKGLGLMIVYVAIVLVLAAVWIAGLVGGVVGLDTVLGTDGLAETCVGVAWAIAWTIGTGFGAYDLAERL